MRLIPDWKIAWKFLSVQAAVLLAVLSGIQGEVLPLVAPLFPAAVWPWVSGGLALSIVLLRLLKQDGLTDDRAVLKLDEFERAAGRVPLSKMFPEDADREGHRP